MVSHGVERVESQEGLKLILITVAFIFIYHVCRISRRVETQERSKPAVSLYYSSVESQEGLKLFPRYTSEPTTRDAVESQEGLKQKRLVLCNAPQRRDV